MNLQQTFEQWPEPDKPPFSGIQEIGCCDEHEEEFDWYRNHTWQDLRDLILSTEEILGHTLDRVQFGSLHPIVRQYFMKGVLSSLTQKAIKYDHFDQVNDQDWTWVTEIEYDLKRMDRNDQYPEPYSEEEVKNVIELIEFIQQKFTIDPASDYYKTDKEIKIALENWKKYLDAISPEKNPRNSKREIKNR